MYPSRQKKCLIVGMFGIPLIIKNFCYLLFCFIGRPNRRSENFRIYSELKSLSKFNPQFISVDFEIANINVITLFLYF